MMRSRSLSYWLPRNCLRPLTVRQCHFLQTPAVGLKEQKDQEMGDVLPADGEGAGGGVGAPADEVGIVQRCGASTAGRD
jgi:hypothetical protein